MKLYDKVDRDKLVEVCTLYLDSYFAVASICNDTEASVGTSFFIDSNGRYTRLWDGSYVDSFFTGSRGNTKVLPIDKDTAVKLAREYRIGGSK